MCVVHSRDTHIISVFSYKIMVFGKYNFFSLTLKITNKSTRIKYRIHFLKICTYRFKSCTFIIILVAGLLYTCYIFKQKTDGKYSECKLTFALSVFLQGSIFFAYVHSYGWCTGVTKNTPITMVTTDNLAKFTHLFSVLIKFTTNLFKFKKAVTHHVSLKAQIKLWAT